MELGAHSPSSLFLYGYRKEKKHWSHTTFPRSGLFSQPWSKPLPATLALMVLTTLLGSAFGLVLTWAQVSEDKVGAGLAKGYVFTLRCTPSDCLALFGLLWTPPIFELVVGH